MFNQTFTVKGSSLPLMIPGESGVVSRLHNTSNEVMEKLQTFGLLPGSPIQLKQRSPQFVVCSGLNCFTLDNATAQAIYVRLTD